jgi:hypothetical protein
MSAQNNTQNILYVSAAMPVIAIMMAILFVALPSRAQNNCMSTAGYGCKAQMEQTGIQKVPTHFKFQARISQSKLPVGDVSFPKVIVKVVVGGADKCEESFNNVVVRDSVLNLEFGRTSSCDLDSYIATSNEVKLKVCINNPNTCLQEVEFSTVPYSVKSSYAYIADNAHIAQTSMQAHFAHLIAADKELFSTNQIGKGFYDFHTPTNIEIANLIPMRSVQNGVQWDIPTTTWTEGGYMQWASTVNTPGNLHVCQRAANAVGNPVGRLDQFVVHATTTAVQGRLVIEGDETTGATESKGALINKGMTVQGGNIDLKGSTFIGEGSSQVCSVLSSFIAQIQATFNGDVTISETSNLFAVKAKSSVFFGPVQTNGTLTANAQTTFAANSSPIFDAVTKFNRQTMFNDSVTFSGSDKKIQVNMPIAFGEGTLEKPTKQFPMDVYNDMTVLGSTTFKGKVDVNNLSVSGNTVFSGNVTFGQKVEIPSDQLVSSLRAGSVKSMHIDTDAIVGPQIKSGAIENRHLNGPIIENKNLTAACVKSNNIDTDAVGGSQIKSGAIENRHLNGLRLNNKLIMVLALPTTEGHTEDVVNLRRPESDYLNVKGTNSKIENASFCFMSKIAIIPKTSTSIASYCQVTYETMPSLKDGKSMGWSIRRSDSANVECWATCIID